MRFVVHFFAHLTDTLRSICSIEVSGETLEEAHSAAVTLLPTVNGAMGFRLCDSADRQLDVYVPVDSIAPGG